MTSLDQDIRFALRAFARRPVVTIATAASLALAIAANTAVFSVVNGALLKPLAGVGRSERLVEIARSTGGQFADVSFDMYRHLATQPQLEGLAAIALESVSLADGSARRVYGAGAVTASYFTLLGVAPYRGRLFAPREASFPDVAPVAMITHELWQRDMGGDPDVIGRTVRVNGRAVEVVGILPPGFAGHHTGLLVDLFLPIGLDVPGLPRPEVLASGTSSSVELLGRLRPGVTPSAAQQALSAAADARARETGESTAQQPFTVRVDEWAPLPATVRTPVSVFLGGLAALVALALAMAGMNVATIVIARSSERRRELAVRRAIGATERRLARQLVTEAIVLFVASGVLGVGLARWVTGLAGGIEPPVPLPGRLGADLGFDWRVAGFSVVVTLGAALLFSLLPSLGAGRFDLAPALRDGGASDGRGRVRLRSALVGVQLTVTCVLLAAMLLVGRALSTMRDLEPGWDADGVLITSIDLELNGTPASAGPELQRRLLERVSDIPGVEVAALATKTQRGGRASLGLVSAPGADLAPGTVGLDAYLNRVSPGYLATLRIPLLSGRDIAETDDASAPRAAVINQTMARRLFPGVDPVGRTFAPVSDPGRPFTVVGVAADAELRSPGQANPAFYYVSLAQWYNPQVNLNVRTSRERLASIAAEVARAVESVAPSLPLTSVRPLEDALRVYLLPHRLAAWVAGMSGLFGLLLAAIGIYGVTAFLVSRRAREIAIRQALGASRADVLALLVRDGGRAPLVGLAVGMMLAVGLSIGLSNVLDGARAADPVALIGALAAIVGVTALALLIPARRLLAGGLMTILREE